MRDESNGRMGVAGLEVFFFRKKFEGRGENMK